MERRLLFSSKLLLLGEHAIVIGSKGFAIPYPHYGGQWIYETPIQPEDFNSKESLKQFADYIQHKSPTQKPFQSIDIQRFKSKIDSGLYFKSNIPQGYGLGSSGALCAGVVYEFGKPDMISDMDLNELRHLFALLESHFHGSSSGVDPLICYLNKPLLLLSRSEAEVVSLPEFSGENGVIFLLDTGIQRKTGPLVNLFLERCENPDYRRLIDEQLNPFNESAVISFLVNDIPAFEEAWLAISQFQLEHFKPMIPEGFERIWQKGLESGEFYLKICGAGGGGYFLGYAPKIDNGTANLPDGTLVVMEV
ncbi:MAG: mevalonate kinase [Bacteroidota bacterium]